MLSAENRSALWSLRKTFYEIPGNRPAWGFCRRADPGARRARLFRPDLLRSAFPRTRPCRAIRADESLLDATQGNYSRVALSNAAARGSQAGPLRARRRA